MGQPGDQPFPWLPIAVITGLALIITFAVGLGVHYCPWWQ